MDHISLMLIAAIAALCLVSTRAYYLPTDLEAEFEPRIRDLDSEDSARKLFKFLFYFMTFKTRPPNQRSWFTSTSHFTARLLNNFSHGVDVRRSVKHSKLPNCSSKTLVVLLNNS